MRTELIDLAGDRIPPDVRELWNCFRAKNVDLASPFFAPEFAEIVARAGCDIQLALIKISGETLGIFPFERRRLNLSGPVGRYLSDYHGLIANSGLKIDTRALLRACGLAAWDYAHVPTSQEAFSSSHREGHQRSPVIDLSNGYPAYVQERREAGTELLKKNGNLLRRLEREVGQLRFSTHCGDRDTLATLVKWKTEQFRRNGWRDLFSIPWVRSVIEQIHATQTFGFAGMLSTLHAGDRLVAVHFGMRSVSEWHYWFPAYDPSFSRYSPGVMLLLKMAEAAPSIGITKIDLGCGEHSYKWRLMNDYTPTASGSVEVACPLIFARRVWTPIAQAPATARSIVGKSPIGAFIRELRSRRA